MSEQPQVYPFDWCGDDSRTMRVVVTHDNVVTVEQSDGRDALGIERWVAVVFDDDERWGRVTCTRSWVEMVVLAVVHGAPS